MRWSTSSAWVCGGVAIVTASTPSIASASSSAVNARSDAELAGPLLRPVGIPSDDRLHVETRAAQRAHVGDAAEPGSDDDRAPRFGLGHVPRGVMPAAT